MREKKKINWRKRLITLAILIVLAIIALYSGPITRNYSIQSTKIDNDINIVVISDLHNQYFGEAQEKLIDRMIAAQPDIILLAGDMTNSGYESDAMVMFMLKAVEIAPTYYVSGNHEYWSMTVPLVKQLVAETGVKVLNNEMVTLDINGNTIELYGIDDYAANQYDGDFEEENWETKLANLWSDNLDNNFRILLSHRPERVDDYQKYDYDLVVAGHAHGGIVRIPFILNGLYGPDEGYFPKYAGGEYTFNSTTMIVSRGVYNYTYMPRVFNPSEVVVITLGGEA